MSKLTLDEWVTRFGPIAGDNQSCMGINGKTYGFVRAAEAVSFAKARDLEVGHVWTVRDCPAEAEGEEDLWIITPGIGCVDVICFVVTEKHSEDVWIEWD